ncbi:uncharacterized protein VDAG_05054 [Verticillium dahliae VdLs.17]|uniref:Xylanolytic transcriptional activator regulatory domain-containing protein n=1 Tax=Verticillium dahliae (strain VdLs.17 / ATCC MYA-4575 / FGSC 10137) TaxID=498257 RepID=G2X4H2_VERDV|nr:uncharacterized protein VDAG_05054 [Verticillium dahliae VdLs.17]EGY23616.1 hypothetical protein VDAG_05054 [Verticillium dahliae VdLs.17]KAH6693189.1 hypothetical protein EV126DRAFT_346510 [Verticillium dahliae]
MVLRPSKTLAVPSIINTRIGQPHNAMALMVQFVGSRSGFAGCLLDPGDQNFNDAIHDGPRDISAMGAVQGNTPIALRAAPHPCTASSVQQTPSPHGLRPTATLGEMTVGTAKQRDEKGLESGQGMRARHAAEGALVSPGLGRQATPYAPRPSEGAAQCRGHLLLLSEVSATCASRKRRKIAAAVRHASQLAGAANAKTLGVPTFARPDGDRQSETSWPNAVEAPRDANQPDASSSKDHASQSSGFSPTVSTRKPFRQGLLKQEYEHRPARTPRPDIMRAHSHGAGAQAQTMLEFELLAGKGMDVGRREVLKAAVALSNQPSTTTPQIDPEAEIYSGLDLDDESMYPSAEVLHFILDAPTQHQSVGLSYILDMVSRETIEKQGIALIEGTAKSPARLHYMVNLNYAAWLYLHATISGTISPAMKQHLIRRREHYEANLLAAVHSIGVLDVPSLSLFQALLSGTMFMIHTGRVEKSWNLSSAASRVCVALGGRYFTNLATTANSAEATAARYCLTLCFMFDKSLSLTMNRVSALPDINLNVAMVTPFDPSRPYTALPDVYLEFALVSDEIIKGRQRRPEVNRQMDVVQSLQQKMWPIGEKIRHFRSKPLNDQDAYLAAEWIGADFVYHSIMTAIFRLHPGLSEDYFSLIDGAIAGVCRLFEKFVTLCRPLVEKESPAASPETGAQQQPQQQKPGRPQQDRGEGMHILANMFRKPPGPMGNENNVMMGGVEPTVPIFTGGDMSMAYGGQPHGYDPMSHINTLGEEDLLLQLGNTHPSLEWIEGAWPT